MEIVKSFTNNTKEYNITIKGTEKNPLFRATDIGEILGLKQIRNTIQDFDETEKDALRVCTPGGMQSVTFLTTFGLYKILTISKKPIAKIFQKWMFNTVEEIRLTGEYKLNKKIQDLENIVDKTKEQLEFKNELIIKKEKELEEASRVTEEELKRMKEKTMLYSYPEGKQVIYIGIINDIFKFGYSDNIERRIREHKRDFGPNFLLLHIIESSSNIRIEKEIKKVLKSKIISRVINGKNQTELIEVSENYTLENFINQIQSIKDNFLKTLTIDILEKEINEKNDRILELENIEIELNKKIKSNEKLYSEKDKELDFVNKKAYGSNKYVLELTHEIQKKDIKIKEITDIIKKTIPSSPYFHPQPTLPVTDELMSELEKISESTSEYKIDRFGGTVGEQQSIELDNMDKQLCTNSVISGFSDPDPGQVDVSTTKEASQQAKVEDILNKKSIYKIKIPVKKYDKLIIARCIKTGKEKIFKTYMEANLDPDIKIGVHSLPDNYLNKPRQFKGYVFYEPGKPYWKPPINFIFYELKKPSTHMKMCKSIEISTGNVTFYNSMLEASWHLSLIYKDFEFSETHRKMLRFACDNHTSITHPVSLYKWSKCDEFFGSWSSPTI